MSKKHRDADLILKLYELRREKTMREARNWFFTFNPQGTEDFMDVLTSDKSALVVAYCGNEYCTAYQAAASVAQRA